MDLLFYLFWLVVIVGVLVVFNAIQSGTMKARTVVGGSVEAVRDRISALRNSIRQRLAKVRDAIRRNSGKIIVGSGVAVSAGAVLVAVRAGWFATLLPSAVPAAAEIEATVTSSWSAASTGARISSGIALTTAAARGEADGATWQTWTNIAGTKQAVQTMQPNAPYQFTLALTPGEVELAGAQETIASAAAQQAVRDTLLTQRQVVLKAVFLAAPERLSLPAGRVGGKAIGHRRATTARRSQSVRSDDRWTLVVERAFGADLRRADRSEQGWDRASVLLMANNRGIDQIVTTHCIGECTWEPPEGRISGSPRLLAMLQEADSADIALFLTEFEQGSVDGVLVSGEPVRVSTRGRGTHCAKVTPLRMCWRQRSRAQGASIHASELLSKGIASSGLVFGGTAAGSQAQDVSTNSRKSSQWQLGEGEGTQEPVRPFRFLGEEGQPRIVPAGLMTFIDAAGKPDFVGHHFHDRTADDGARAMACLLNARRNGSVDAEHREP